MLNSAKTMLNQLHISGVLVMTGLVPCGAAGIPSPSVLCGV